MLVAKYYCETFDPDANLLHDAIECGRQFRRSLMMLENETRDRLRLLEDESEVVKTRRVRAARWRRYAENLTSGDPRRLEIAKGALNRASTDFEAALYARKAQADFTPRKEEDFREHDLPRGRQAQGVHPRRAGAAAPYRLLTGREKGRRSLDF
jgi:hypothetical protein